MNYLWFLISAGAAYLASTFSSEAMANTMEKNSIKDYPNWTKYDSIFKKWGSTHGVNWKWLKATAIVESTLGQNKRVAVGERNPADIEGSKSTDGLSWGLMQVTLNTARDLDPLATVEKLNNPDYSVNLAAKYLSQMLRRYSNDQKLTIMSYNQGPGNTDKGKTFAAGYYDKWRAALALVEKNS